MMAQFGRTFIATYRSPAPGERVIETEIPDRGNASADEVGNQVIESDAMQGRQRQPVDEQPSGIDRPIEQGPVHDAASPPVVPGPTLIQGERCDHRQEYG